MIKLNYYPTSQQSAKLSKFIQELLNLIIISVQSVRPLQKAILCQSFCVLITCCDKQQEICCKTAEAPAEYSRGSAADQQTFELERFAIQNEKIAVTPIEI